MNRRAEVIVPWLIVAVAMLGFLASSYRGRSDEDSVQLPVHPLIEVTLVDIEKAREPERPLLLLMGDSTLNMSMLNVEDYVDHRCETRGIERCPQIARVMLPAARMYDFARYIDDIAALEPTAVIVVASSVVSRPLQTDLIVPHPEALRQRPRPGDERTAEDRQRIARQWGPVFFEPNRRDQITFDRLQRALGKTRIGLLILPVCPTLRSVMPDNYRERFLTAVHELGEARGIAVFDAGPDSEWTDASFYDYSHMNRHGVSKIRESGVVGQIVRLGLP